MNKARGISNIVLIILTAAALFGLFTTYFLTGAVNDIKEQKKGEDEIEKRLNDESVFINRLLIDISSLILPMAEGERVKSADIEKYRAEKAKKSLLIPKKDKSTVVTMEMLAREAIDNATASQIKLLRATYEKNIASSRHSKTKDFITVIREQKDEEISSLKSEKSRLSDKLSLETDKYTSLKDKLTAAKKVQEDRLPQLQGKFSLQKTQMENDIALIKFNLDELTTKEVFNRDIVENQGKLIQPNVPNRFACITLGSKDNIKLGWKFMVFRRDNAGIRQWKGQVEVKQLYNDHATVSITALKDPLDPVTEGDTITNIFYHPLAQRSIVLIGKFERGDFVYDKPDMERRLADIGVAVEKKVSLKTDFVIVGKDPEETDIDRNNYLMVKTMNIPRLEDTEAREAFEFFLGD